MELKNESRALRQQLKQKTRKRTKLMHKARALSTDDLAKVMAIRATMDAAKETAAKRKK